MTETVVPLAAIREMGPCEEGYRKVRRRYPGGVPLDVPALDALIVDGVDVVWWLAQVLTPGQRVDALLWTLRWRQETVARLLDRAGLPDHARRVRGLTFRTVADATAAVPIFESASATISAMDSAMDSAIDSATISAMDSARANARTNARDSARARARASARARARARARASAWATVRDSARASARASARDSAWAGTRASAFDSAWASAWASARDSAFDSAFDNAWADLCRAFARWAVPRLLASEVRRVVALGGGVA